MTFKPVARLNHLLPVYCPCQQAYEVKHLLYEVIAFSASGFVWATRRQLIYRFGTSIYNRSGLSNFLILLDHNIASILICHFVHSIHCVHPLEIDRVVAACLYNDSSNTYLTFICQSFTMIALNMLVS